MTDLAALLNPEQFEAATAPDGPLLVLAAAGTGKTRTLVYRVVHLLERGLPPERILLLTFTNRAAREMLARAAEASGGRVDGLWGGTFHHVANRMLRLWAPSFGWPRDFAILDADDQRSLMGHVIKDLGHKPKEFPKRELVLSLLSGAVNRNLSPAEWLEARACPPDAPPEALLACMDEYARRKEAMHAMDFDDLLVGALRLLRENPEARERFQERFVHVLVDEYQDTNALQSAFVDLLSARHRNLSAVGDDFQCIYSWRGSDYRNIMDFPERHPGTRIVKLERNYRSLRPVLDLANASIARNVRQFPKTLRAVRGADAPAPLPVLHEVRDGREQADEVVSVVRDCLDAGFRPSDIAILYRSHFNAVDVQLAFARASIPYAITSGTSFYEQAHVKDVVALLRVAEGLQDDLALSRLLQLLPAVGESTAERVRRKLADGFDPGNGSSRAALAEALPPRARAAWSGLDAALARYGRDPFPSNVSALVGAFLEAFYREHLRKNYENAEDREAELKELLSDIASHEGVRSFLSDVALLTNLDRGGGRGRGAAQGGEVPAVLLSTVHQAKGLEWPVVILLWLAEGLFPSARSMEDENGDEEERRLFYVAVTRAKDRLHLFQPAFRTTPDGGRFRVERSRFLREVPDTLFEHEGGGAFAAPFGGWGGGWGGGSRGGRPRLSVSEVPGLSDWGWGEDAPVYRPGGDSAPPSAPPGPGDGGGEEPGGGVRYGGVHVDLPF